MRLSVACSAETASGGLSAIDELELARDTLRQTLLVTLDELGDAAEAYDPHALAVPCDLAVAGASGCVADAITNYVDAIATHTRRLAEISRGS